MSPHQEQGCFPGLLPSHRDRLLTHSQWVSHGAHGPQGWVLSPWASFLPSLESWFLLETRADWRLVNECPVFQDKGTPAAELGSHPGGTSRLGRRAGSPCPGILLGCEIQPLWHGLVDHDVLPGAEAGSLLKWPVWLRHLLLRAPEYTAWLGVDECRLLGHMSKGGEQGGPQTLLPLCWAPLLLPGDFRPFPRPENVTSPSPPQIPKSGTRGYQLVLILHLDRRVSLPSA